MLIGLYRLDRPSAFMLRYTLNSLVVHEWASILPGHIDLRPNLFIRLEAMCVAFHLVNQKGERKFYESKEKDQSK
jgi:hypothetical protein